MLNGGDYNNAANVLIKFNKGSSERLQTYCCSLVEVFTIVYNALQAYTSTYTHGL